MQSTQTTERECQHLDASIGQNCFAGGDGDDDGDCDDFLQVTIGCTCERGGCGGDPDGDDGYDDHDGVLFCAGPVAAGIICKACYFCIARTSSRFN